MFFVCLSPLKTHGFYLEHQNRHLPHSLSSWTIGLSSAAVAAAAAGVVGVGGRAACHRTQCLSSQVGFGLSLIWGKKSLRALYPRYHDTSPKFSSFLKEINAILNFFTPTKDFHLDDKHFLFYFHRPTMWCLNPINYVRSGQTSTFSFQDGSKFLEPTDSWST